MTWKAMHWRGWPRHHSMTRGVHVFMTVIYDCWMYFATSCPEQLNVRYKSSIITETLSIVVVLNDINSGR